MKSKPIRFTLSREVSGIDDFVDMEKIREKLNEHIEIISSRINIADLSGWGILLNINSVCTDFIGVYKKFLRYPSDKEYVVLISIAIPDNAQVLYGMPPAEDGRIGYFHPASQANCHILDPEYEKYENLDQYIFESAVKAINLGFTKGFTCHGKKIKFQDL